MDIDWSKAPEGATHAHLPSGDWYRLSGAQWEVHYRTGAWQRALWINERLPECVSRDSDWNREDLPPVGTVCERQLSYEKWASTTIHAHSPDGAYAAFYDDNGMGWADHCEFRPLRTPEQIAAEEREAAIAEIGRMLDENPKVAGYSNSSHITLSTLIYDAGYRKQVQP